MAEDLMRNRKRTGEAGFSMIEMLMTAFVMAIGLLGLAMLQTMSLRASRGSRSLSTAVRVASGVLDSVGVEGRLSWLNATDSNAAAPSLADLPLLRYVTLAAGDKRVEQYNSMGSPVDAASADPLVKTPFYTVTITQVPGVASVSGQISDFNVQVQFADSTDTANAPILRTVSLTRRIIHG